MVTVEAMQCLHCDTDKSIDEFHARSDRPGKVVSRCKQCVSLLNSLRHAATQAGKKLCNRCMASKPFDQFVVRSRIKSKMAPWCLECVNAYGREKYQEKIGRKARPKADDGTGYIDDEGYRCICIDGRRMREHRHFIEQIIGRRLLKHEDVHHKNGLRADNRIKPGHELGGCPPTCCNLELWSKSHPSGQRVRDKVEWARHILELYAQHDELNEPRLRPAKGHNAGAALSTAYRAPATEHRAHV